MSKSKRQSKESILATLYKKAMGYTVEEIVEEYSGDEKGGELIKRKITTKPLPPDITALKAYLEMTESDNSYHNMSDEDLERERLRLIEEIVSLKVESKKNN